MDTVLIGGLGFLLTAAVVFLVIKHLGKSSLPETQKRLLTYLCFGVLVILTVVIFDWHSSNYLAEQS